MILKLDQIYEVALTSTIIVKGKFIGMTEDEIHIFESIDNEFGAATWGDREKIKPIIQNYYKRAYGVSEIIPSSKFFLALNNMVIINQFEEIITQLQREIEEC